MYLPMTWNPDEKISCGVLHDATALRSLWRRRDL